MNALKARCQFLNVAQNAQEYYQISFRVFKNQGNVRKMKGGQGNQEYFQIREIKSFVVCFRKCLIQRNSAVNIRF